MEWIKTIEEAVKKYQISPFANNAFSSEILNNNNNNNYNNINNNINNNNNKNTPSKPSTLPPPRPNTNVPSSSPLSLTSPDLSFNKISPHPSTGDELIIVNNNNIYNNNHNNNNNNKESNRDDNNTALSPSLPIPMQKVSKVKEVQLNEKKDEGGDHNYQNQKQDHDGDHHDNDPLLSMSFQLDGRNQKKYSTISGKMNKQMISSSFTSSSKNKMKIYSISNRKKTSSRPTLLSIFSPSSPSSSSSSPDDLLNYSEEDLSENNNNDSDVEDEEDEDDLLHLFDCFDPLFHSLPDPASSLSLVLFFFISLNHSIYSNNNNNNIIPLLFIHFSLLIISICNKCIVINKLF